MSITMCPSSAPAPCAATVQPAVEDQPAADTGADRHDDDLVRADGGARSVLGERCEVPVIVDEHGESEPFGHDRPERKVGEVKVDGDDRFPVRESISDGIPKPTAATSAPAFLRSSSIASCTVVRSVAWSRPTTFRCTRW